MRKLLDLDFGGIASRTGLGRGWIAGELATEEATERSPSETLDDSKLLATLGAPEGR